MCNILDPSGVYQACSTFVIPTFWYPRLNCCAGPSPLKNHMSLTGAPLVAVIF